LSEIDPEIYLQIEPFRETIFSSSSLKFSRIVSMKDSIEEIDRETRTTLLMLSKYFLSPFFGKIFEFLVRFYDVHIHH